MRNVKITYSSVCVGLPLSASEGDVVSATVPDGCVLRKSTDLKTWDAVESTNFAHHGEHTSYRIDCDVFQNPVIAILEITN